jgi:hypothetical protein
MVQQETPGPRKLKGRQQRVSPTYRRELRKGTRRGGIAPAQHARALGHDHALPKRALCHLSQGGARPQLAGAAPSAKRSSQKQNPLPRAHGVVVSHRFACGRPWVQSPVCPLSGILRGAERRRPCRPHCPPRCDWCALLLLPRARRAGPPQPCGTGEAPTSQRLELASKARCCKQRVERPRSRHASIPARQKSGQPPTQAALRSSLSDLRDGQKSPSIEKVVEAWMFGDYTPPPAN